MSETAMATTGKFLRPTEEAYTELQFAYDFFNDNLFASQERLPACLITYQREKRTMGYFSKDRFIRKDGTKADEIAMNPDYFAVIPLVEIFQTLVHEQVHQWQAHFGTRSRAGYHNTEWSNKIQSVGLMPSDTGRPGGKKVGQSMNDYVIPGGRFDLATRRLINTGFAISWMDRFPVNVRAATAISTPQLSSQLAGAGMWIEASVGSPDDDEIPDPEDAETLAYAGAPPSAGGLDIEIRGDADRSNRWKYTCPTCPRVNVWGRPGLKLICGECMKQMSPLVGVGKDYGQPSGEGQ